ncbi:transcription factor A, mitochondrial isoform X2 [Thalassophryne amazonica]|uniref:transcription factor A, mitochondrial isoform X2 n=1 Tax=Thalassophryne amazonica TaxID=390379 RepID=UPI001472541E|nr:transcription factor A, mitochondrial isoform X2 [Thalassophryne amazonica]
MMLQENFCFAEQAHHTPSHSSCRWRNSLPTAHINQVKCLASQASGRPKRPVNSYMRYFIHQRPIVKKEQANLKIMDIAKIVAQQWKKMSPEEKQPFNEEFLQARRQYNMDLQHYQAQLTPAQRKQEALDKRQSIDKKNAIRKKKELQMLGKPKRARSSFNIFMSERYQEAQGATPQQRLKSLLENWRNLLSEQRQVYTQLAEDDKIRYKNELKSWKDHMLEIGRSDVIRDGTRPATKPRKRSVAKTK